MTGPRAGDRAVLPRGRLERGLIVAQRYGLGSLSPALLGLCRGQYLLSWLPIQGFPYERMSQFYDVKFPRSTLPCQRMASLPKRLSTRAQVKKSFYSMQMCDEL